MQKAIGRPPRIGVLATTLTPNRALPCPRGLFCRSEEGPLPPGGWLHVPVWLLVFSSKEDANSEHRDHDGTNRELERATRAAAARRRTLSSLNLRPALLSPHTLPI